MQAVDRRRLEPQPRRNRFLEVDRLPRLLPFFGDLAPIVREPVSSLFPVMFETSLIIVVLLLIFAILFILFKPCSLGNASNYGKMKVDLHNAGWPESSPPVKSTEIDGVWELTDYFQNGRPISEIVAKKYVIYRQCGFQLITIRGIPYSLYFYFLSNDSGQKTILFRGPDGDFKERYSIVGDKMYLGPRDSPDAIYQRITVT